MISHAKPDGSASVQTQGSGEPAEVSSEKTKSGRRVPPYPLDPLFSDLAALRSFAAHYLAAQKDSFAVTTRRILLWAAAGIAAGLAGVAALVTAVVLLLNGIADGLAVLFGDRWWLGELVTAVGVMVLMGLAAWISVKVVLGKSRKRTFEQYERRRRQEKARLGRTV